MYRIPYRERCLRLNVNSVHIDYEKKRKEKQVTSCCLVVNAE